MTKKELELRDDFYSFPTYPKCHKLYNKQEVEDYKENDINSVIKYYSNIETKVLKKLFPNVMIAAMHKRTKIGCEGLIQDVINNCSVPAVQNYIKRNYVKNIQQWGLWARQHSPLLLQVTSTNLLESFHSELKRITSLLHGLIDATHNIVNVDYKKRSESESAAFNFHIKKVFAYSVDNSILEEIHKLTVAELTERVRNRYWSVEETGPNEISLHKINHYLVPIVDELESLWNGIILNKTNNCPNGKKIWAALILVSCNVPAVRKICGHISALVSCHRCEKKTNYKNQQHNFVEMDDIDKWFIAKDLSKYLENALKWRSCNSDSARKKFTKNRDRKILIYFVRICHLFVNRILETKSLDEIHKKIVDIVILIEKKYRRNVITPNLHLSLHLSTYSHDFGSLYAFWYFSFKRINRILELMHRLINDNRINKMIYTENNSKGLEILNARQSVGSFSEIDQFGHDEIRRFWIHQKSSYILTKFASENDSIDIYPDQIQFFFVHEISTNRINMKNHYLVYVRWYKKIKNWFYFGINQEQMCNVELWDTEFYPKS
ncbi:hypothetical protein Glove_186g68 [Diversispora epigaea]|uniref:Transposase domain-containing protein n=1 Tax=Diversispora epigaea TaxID=1348612 RepID=A0A397IWG8_9GLOM|nr:hypothetical protein Glove_186g68 [Diversispora epigaea]